MLDVGSRVRCGVGPRRAVLDVVLAQRGAMLDVVLVPGRAVLVVALALRGAMLDVLLVPGEPC